jgi:hypothetical protein
MWRRNASGTRDSGNLHRPVLASIVALGGVLTLAGTTGVFATFTDHATTGTNSVTSKALPKAADVQLAIGTPQGDGSVISCGTYSDDLETPVMTVTNAEAGGAFGSTFVCIKNAGSQSIEVTTSTLGLTDEDVDCTGDENQVDETCGLDVNDVPQAGELSPLLNVRVTTAPCISANDFFQYPPVALPSLSDLDIGGLAPNAVMCANFGLFYDATESQALTAQSDTVTWQYALDAATF